MMQAAVQKNWRSHHNCRSPCTMRIGHWVTWKSCQMVICHRVLNWRFYMLIEFIDKTLCIGKHFFKRLRWLRNNSVSVDASEWYIFTIDIGNFHSRNLTTLMGSNYQIQKAKGKELVDLRALWYNEYSILPVRIFYVLEKPLQGFRPESELWFLRPAFQCIDG